MDGQMNIFDSVEPKPSQMPMKDYLTKMGYKNEYFERPDHECIVEVVDIHEYPNLHFYEAKYVKSFGNIVQEYPQKCGYECHWWKEIRPILNDLPDFCHPDDDWHSIETKPQGIDDRIKLRVCGQYRFNNKDYWSICPAYFDGTEIIATDVPFDIPRPKWKFWRIYPISVDIVGICDDAVCPICGHEFLYPMENDKKYCPDCGQRMDWKRWHQINDNENEQNE